MYKFKRHQWVIYNGERAEQCITKILSLSLTRKTARIILRDFAGTPKWSQVPIADIEEIPYRIGDKILYIPEYYGFDITKGQVRYLQNITYMGYSCVTKLPEPLGHRRVVVCAPHTVFPLDSQV